MTSLAASLVRETLSHFTRERQPFVLAEASEMFSKVTGGRYERILPSIEEDGIVLMSAGGSANTLILNPRPCYCIFSIMRMVDVLRTCE